MERMLIVYCCFGKVLKIILLMPIHSPSLIPPNQFFISFNSLPIEWLSIGRELKFLGSHSLNLHNCELENITALK